MDRQDVQNFFSKKDEQSVAQPLYYHGNRIYARNWAILRFYREGLTVRQICKVFGLSRTTVELALVEAQNRDFIIKGISCFDCGSKVTVVHHGKNPIMATCKRGHSCTVVFNPELKIFQVV